MIKVKRGLLVVSITLMGAWACAPVAPSLDKNVFNEKGKPSIQGFSSFESDSSDSSEAIVVDTQTDIWTKDDLFIKENDWRKDQDWVEVKGNCVSEIKAHGICSLVLKNLDQKIPTWVALSTSAISLPTPSIEVILTVLNPKTGETQIEIRPEDEIAFETSGLKNSLNKLYIGYLK